MTDKSPINTDVVIRPIAIDLPADIDPGVLRPGAIVRAFLDGEHNQLTVLRVEPMLVCCDKHGQEVTLAAHEVYLDGPRPTFHVVDQDGPR